MNNTFKDKASQYLLKNGYVYENKVKFAKFTFILGIIFTFLMLATFTSLAVHSGNEWNVASTLFFFMMTCFLSVGFIFAGFLFAKILMVFIGSTIQYFLGNCFVDACTANPEFVSWSTENS